MDRRRLLQLGGTGLALTALGGAAGCRSNGTTSAPKPHKLTNVPAYSEPIKVEGAIIPEVAGVPIGYTSLPKDLVTTVPEPPGRGGPLTHFHITWMWA